MTAPYQTGAPSSTMTSPTSVAVGARNARACTCGMSPSNENSAIGVDRLRAADARPAQRHRCLGRVGNRWRPRRHPNVHVLDDFLVHGVSEHLAQLGLHRLVHGLGAGEGLLGLGAPPPELLAALAPAVAAELGEDRRDRLVFLVSVDGAQRQLPAHGRLRVAEVLAGVHRVQVQRASRSGFEIRTVEEDARVLVEARLPLTLTRALPHAAFQADLLELPLVVAELLGELLDLFLDLLLRLVRTVGAAPLDELRCGFGQHALT